MIQQERLRSVVIGGPGTILPRFVESSLSWCLCISCLGVSGYYWCKATVTPALKYLQKVIRGRTLVKAMDDYGETPSSSEENVRLVHAQCALQNIPFLENPFIPLTTASRNEISSKSPKERYEQLVRYISSCVFVECKNQKTEISDDELVHLCRSNDVCRRLASLAMRPYRQTLEGGRGQNAGRMTSILEEYPNLNLPKRLAALWPQLLTLPSVGSYCPRMRTENRNDLSRVDGKYPYRISLIVPAFREKGTELSRKLKKAFEACGHPSSIELILVDAGGCSDLELVCLNHCMVISGKEEHQNQSVASKSDKSISMRWGRAILLPFSDGGGRGPCLNFGASRAQGQFLTFLHSDTTLPPAWDEKIETALQHTDKCGRRSNCCAFSFGIDTSEEGLANRPFPPGIKAVETTANLRTHIFSLPYGDQCISVPNEVFRFLGGFPDQCLMEDYELVSLLRQRASHLPRYYPGSPDAGKEMVFIINGAPALCSPRRWQTFGVLYVTYMNSKFVNLYAGGLPPDDLFKRYYGDNPPQRSIQRSPWELKLENQNKKYGVL